MAGGQTVGRLVSFLASLPQDACLGTDPSKTFSARTSASRAGRPVPRAQTARCARTARGAQGGRRGRRSRSFLGHHGPISSPSARGLPCPARSSRAASCLSTGQGRPRAEGRRPLFALLAFGEAFLEFAFGGFEGAVAANAVVDEDRQPYRSADEHQHGNAHGQKRRLDLYGIGE